MKKWSWNDFSRIFLYPSLRRTLDLLIRLNGRRHRNFLPYCSNMAYSISDTSNPPWNTFYRLCSNNRKGCHLEIVSASNQNHLNPSNLYRIGLNACKVEIGEYRKLFLRISSHERSIFYVIFFRLQTHWCIYCKISAQTISISIHSIDN